MRKLRVLVGCESSGKVREAFRRLGHEAWSVDLLPSDDDSEYHIQGDIVSVLLAHTTKARWQQPMPHGLPRRWDIGIFHPPCTRLCNSGVRWLHERDLWNEMREGAELFLACLNAPIPFVAVENPVMHKYAREIVGRGPDFTVQPYHFGDDASKRTGFWVRNLPALRPTGFVEPRLVQGKQRWANQTDSGQNKVAPSANRWKERSETYQGIADAIADQWGNYVSAQLERAAA